MTELIMKMLVCLLGALIIGFIFGYLISKVFGKKKHKKEVEELSSLLSSEEKKNALLKDELSIVKDASAAQTLQLTEKEKELESHSKTVQELNNLFKQKDKNNILLKEKLLQAEESFSEQALMLSEAEGEIKRHAIVVKDLNTIVEQLEQENILLTNELTKVKKELDNNSFKLKESEKEINSFKEQNTIQEKTVQDKKNEVSQIAEELNKATDSHSLLEEEATQLRNDNEKLHVLPIQEKESSVEKTETPNVKIPKIEQETTKEVSNPKAEIKEENKVEDAAITGGLLNGIKGLFDKVTKPEVETDTPNINNPTEAKVAEIEVPDVQDTLNKDMTKDIKEGNKAIEIYRDNLQDIKGIGENVESKLNDIGIYSFEQISKWSSEDIQTIKEKIPFNIEIEDENWIEQAKLLIKDRDK